MRVHMLSLLLPVVPGNPDWRGLFMQDHPRRDALLTGDRYSLRERTLWRMLYETAARSAEVLRLDVADLDLPNRRARVPGKGGAIDVIVWQTGTARLLKRQTTGPRPASGGHTHRSHPGGLATAKVTRPCGASSKGPARTRLSGRWI